MRRTHASGYGKRAPGPEIVVTGSRIHRTRWTRNSRRHGRPDRDRAATGLSSVADVLQRLPAPPAA